jgi:hypothetical protein
VLIYDRFQFVDLCTSLAISVSIKCMCIDLSLVVAMATKWYSAPDFRGRLCIGWVSVYVTGSFLVPWFTFFYFCFTAAKYKTCKIWGFHGGYDNDVFFGGGGLRRRVHWSAAASVSEKHTISIFRAHFGPEDGDIMLLRSVDIYQPIHTAPEFGRSSFSSIKQLTVTSVSRKMRFLTLFMSIRLSIL